MNKKNKLAVWTVILLAGVILLSLIWKYVFITTGIAVLAWIIILYFRKEELPYLVSGAVIGPVAEIVWIYFGAWTYTAPTFFGIPLWLPLLWGLAIVIIKNIGILFKDVFFK